MDEEKNSYKNPLAGLDLAEVQSLLKETLSTLPHGYKLPYMQWYEDDFKSSDGVEELAPLARLMYRQLLAKAWVSREAPYLPADKERLMRLADCPDEESWKKHGPSVLSMFRKTKDKKRLFHSRQLLDYTAQISKISANTINGKKGGRPPKSKETKDEQETQSKPIQNPTKRQPELELKPESKSKSEPKPDEIFIENLEELDMKIQNEAKAVCEGFGVLVGGYKSDWDDMAILARQYKVGAVINDLKDFLEENLGDDFPKGVVPRYLQVAHDRLSSDVAPAAATLKDPEVVSLARELSYLSDGQIAFLDKQKIRLSEVLKEFAAEEITTCFKSWLEEQDLSDPKNLSFLPGKFVQIVDGRAYALRKKRTEQTVAAKDRAAAVIKLQQEAETARQESERARLVEENAFDPLSS